jgi:hypothetical protein
MKTLNNEKVIKGYQLINQFNGTYQILDAQGIDIIGEYLNLKNSKQAIKDHISSLKG